MCSITLQIPSKTTEKIKQKVSIVTKLVKNYEDNPDPDIAKIGTEICKNSAAESLNFLKKERFPHNFKSDVMDNAMYILLEKLKKRTKREIFQGSSKLFAGSKQTK